MHNIQEHDFRTAGRFCARNARLGVQTLPVGTLAVVVAAHLGLLPQHIAWSAFIVSVVIAAVRWFCAQRMLRMVHFSRRRWQWFIAAPALAANLTWAIMASLMLWQEGVTSTTNLILLGSIALAFGCTSSFAPVRALSLPLLAIHLGLPLFATFFIDGAERVILGVLLVAFLLYILRIADNLHNDYWSALHTRNHLTEARLQAEQASHAKDQFLANISHEIRTPLNGITAPVELLRETALDNQQRHLVGLINSSSQTLMQLIDDLLDFSKMEAGKLRLQPRPFAPQLFLHDLAERHRLAAAQKGLALRLTTNEATQHHLLGDPLRIGQIVDNLLSNAVKFTTAGRVDIDAEVYTSGIIGQLRIRIADTGCGIPAELQPDIFKPFVQAERSASRSHAGTGLGLSICKRLTEQMEGDLSFVSTNRGTCFTLQLQLPRSADAASDTAAATVRRFPDLRVLVAEDNPVNQEVIRHQLALLGIVPDIVGDGRAALAATAHTAYDLIILDCQMPVLDGYQTAARLRAQQATAATPIVALTAHAMSNDMKRALDAGMDDYLSKPVAMATLSDTIARWTDSAH